jgi:chromosome segregation ATPase
MPDKKRQPAKPEGGGGPVMVILEEIRSQNRAALEAVEGHHQEIRRELQDFRREVQSETRMFRAAVQGNSADLQQLKTEVSALKEQVARVDAVITVDYRERLHRLEERVEALERKPA